MRIGRTAALVLEVMADEQFTAKSLQRQAKKANKDETTEKNKVKLVRQVLKCESYGANARRHYKKEIQKEPRSTPRMPFVKRPRASTSSA